MNIFDERNLAGYFIITSALVIVGLILWNTSLFFQSLKEDERIKMEVWAQSYRALNSLQEDDYLDLSILISSTNNTLPIMITDANNDFIKDDEGQIIESNFKNIPEDVLDNEEALKVFLQKIRAENAPIILDLKGTVQHLNYGSSEVLNKLKYYPIAIVLIVFLLIGVIYFFFNTSKISEQNKLWAGMAKETAHQIGTPLSSLIGWNEILKSENLNPEYVYEMQKDIKRLNVITERFSKIGSIPDLEVLNIVDETTKAYEYLQSRSSKLIDFSLDLPENKIFVDLNSQLFGWTIENLVKNAIDAMKGKGKLHIELLEDSKRVYIHVTDTGKGIHKRQFTRIFTPGYTSKTRGWGLGLSLAKRIIEEYHLGKIRVLKSEIGKGTTFQIALRKFDMQV